MKYLLLLVLSITAIAASLTGCSDDIYHSHDIYRAHYDYKPLPQQDTAAPTPKPNAMDVPPSES